MSNVSVAQRRGCLLDWLVESSKHENLTAAEIADVSGIYEGHYAASRCFDDLKVLQSRELVIRTDDRPARWWTT